jgi:hypothetical protein
MKKGAFLALMTVALIFSASPVLSQSLDLSGTWVGETVVSSDGDKDQVTLVLTKEGESYSGNVTDSMGMANESPLEKVEFKDNTLTAEFVIFNGEEYVRISMTLEVKGERLVGEWQSDDGETGPLDLERKKTA